MGPPSSAVTIMLDRRLESVRIELAAAAGAESLCAISRSGGSVPGVKYLEGRMAAISEVRRAVRGGRPFVDVLAERTSAWRAELVRATETSMGIDWRAYRAGGVDELESFQESAPDSTTPPGCG